MKNAKIDIDDICLCNDKDINKPNGIYDNEMEVFYCKDCFENVCL